MAEEHEEGFEGPATLVVDGTEFAVTVRLRGIFQPIDGYYHWYGRVAVSPELTAHLRGGNAPVLVRTAFGEAEGELCDPDPWGRYRVDGVSVPPFAMVTSLADL
ncbi:MAG TPA: DUF4873 domain-containing protein [Pseudonocardiaceae bacterium]